MSSISAGLDRLRPGAGRSLVERAHPAWDPMSLMMAGICERSLAIADVATETAGLPLTSVAPHCTASVPSRAWSFIAGRCCAERALRDLAACHGPVRRDNQGAPVWPDGLLGSISHDAEGAVCLVAWRAEVAMLGVDVELQLDADTQAAVVGSCLTPAEHEWLSHPTASPSDVTAVFAAKEAYYKAVNPVLNCWIEFTDVELTMQDSKAWTFAMTPVPGTSIGYRLPVLRGQALFNAGRAMAVVRS